VTEPNEFDEFRRRLGEEERRRRNVVRVPNVLTALAVLAVGVLVPESDPLLGAGFAGGRAPEATRDPAHKFHQARKPAKPASLTRAANGQTAPHQPH
jgi:hypothetical protein